MGDKYSLSSFKLNKLISTKNESIIKTSKDIKQQILNIKTIDITSRLGQFAWRQIAPSTTPLPIIFRHDHREEYLCVQMINIHLLSKFPSEILSYCMKQSPIHYFSITECEGKLFQYINKFHSNGILADNHILDYSNINLAYITPYMSFIYFYQFISSHSQFIKNNGLWVPSKTSEPNLEQKTQPVDNKSSSKKMISSTAPNKRKSNNSYCRSITFHEKEIMSYSTTTVTDSNETTLCLSIKDIISSYFPWTTPEKFIQLCRIKQIVRYKPDTPNVNSDLSLRLINMKQLDQHWEFFIQELLPNTQIVSSNLNKNTDEKSPIKSPIPSTIETNESPSISSSNIIEQSVENIVNIEVDSTSPQRESAPCQMDLIEQTQVETNSEMDKQIEIIEEQQQQQLQQENLSENQIELSMDSLEIEEEEKTMKVTKTIKRKRHRVQKTHFTKRKRKQNGLNKQMKQWIKKYSIEPISIILHRVNLLID